MSTSVVPFDSKSTEDEDNEDNAPKRKLSRKQSIASKTEEADLKNENMVQSFVFDVWDIFCYTMVKLVAPSRRCCCLRSCRGTHKHMYTRVKDAHIGLAVNFDDFTNLINTLLLLDALFLSFVAATMTTLSDEQLLKQDLIACQQSWAPTDVCIGLDHGGYFHQTNITGLLTDGMMETATDVMATHRPAVSLASLVHFVNPLDSGVLMAGTELPSIAILWYSSMSIGLLINILLICVTLYLILVLSGARSMGTEVMNTLWTYSFPAVMVSLLGIMLAVVFWLQSFSRINGGLTPDYCINGLEFIFYTHADQTINIATLSNAYAGEGILMWGVFFVALPLLTLSGMMTFRTEKNYVLRERPTTIASFVKQALKHLDANDLLGSQRAISSNINSETDVKSSAIARVTAIFADEGYVVGYEGEEETSLQEMEHFIKEFNHLKWDNLVNLSTREHACLHRLHAELYGDA